MQRLLWLLAGLILAGYGLGLIAGADAFWPYVVRDGLMVALAGGLIFAAHTGPLPALLLGRRAWPPPAQIALITGVACSLAATAVLALVGSRGWPAWLGGSLWTLALGLWAAALLWPGAADYALPAYRWTRDAAGRMVRLALEGASAERSIPLPVRSRALNLALLAVLGMGWVLRLWRLAALPPDCLDVECAQALRLMDGSWWSGLDAASAGLHALTAAAIYRVGGDALPALRGAAALIGCATLPVFYWAARAYAGRAGALLGLALLAFSPWHLWASRTGDAWTAAPLLLLVALGAAGRAVHTADLHWWGLAGGALGLLAAQPLPLQAASGLYALGVAAAGGWAMRRQEDKAARSAMWVALGSSLAVGLPLALAAWRSQSAAVAEEIDWWSRLSALLHSGGAALTLFVESPLLPPLAGALVVGGLLALLWRRRDLRGPLVLLGLAIYALAPAAGSARLPGLGLLTWLPFLYVGAAAALDQLVTAFDAAWARLVPLPRAVAAALVLLLAMLGPDVLSLQQQWRTLATGSQDVVEVAMGRYLAQCLSGQAVDVICAQPSESDPVYFVPPAVLAHPSTQLLLGAARDTAGDAERVRPLDVGRDLLPTRSPQSDLVYLVAMDNQPLIDLLRQLYPGAQVHAEPRDQAGPTLFLVYAISQQEVLSHQGLAGTYSRGTGANRPGEIHMDGPLRFAWADDPPLEPPFEVIWEGSLLAPAAGAYLFQIEGIAAQASDPVVSMQLDGRLVLDTSLGLVEQHEQLAQGYTRLTLRYRTSGAPGDWAIIWQPPAGSAEAIPRALLYSPALPTIGLVGTYHAGDTWQGPALTVRTDLVLGAPVDIPPPYSVVWRGQLAVPRAGETLFAVTANGPVQLAVAGQPVLGHLPPAAIDEGPGFSQGSIYLERGWQPIELRYAPPQGQPDLRLLWQPPGSAPMNLLSRYLLPSSAEVTIGDVPLPPAPELIDARLGDERFALSASMEVYQPARTLPPTNLPPLLAEMRRQVGAGCGVGPDQFNLPHGVALDLEIGQVYVADTGNRRVVELDLETGTLAQVYTSEEWQEPVDVELAPDGSLLVLDALAAAIWRVDRATGETAPLVLQTSFYRPRGLGVDASGVLAVADTGGARVALLDPTGAQMAQFGGPATLLGQGQPVDVMAANGQFWTVTAENGRLWQLDMLGSLAALARSNTIDGPHLAALPNGAFFLSDPVGRSVLYFAASGQPLAQVAHGGNWAAPTGVAAALHAGQAVLVVADSVTCQVTFWEVRLE